MTPGAGVLVLGRDHISHTVKMLYLLLYQHTVHYLLVYSWILVLFSYATVVFYLLYDGLFTCKYEHLWQEVNVESLILKWPLRPLGLLLENIAFRVRVFMLYGASELKKHIRVVIILLVFHLKNINFVFYVTLSKLKKL